MVALQSYTYLQNGTSDQVHIITLFNYNNDVMSSDRVMHGNDIPLTMTNIRELCNFLLGHHLLFYYKTSRARSRHRAVRVDTRTCHRNRSNSFLCCTLPRISGVLSCTHLGVGEGFFSAEKWV